MANRNTQRVYLYTIGMDPSGAYHEGKGTTGWCVLNNRTNELLEVGTLSAKDYPTDNEYWKAHTNLIRSLARKYGHSTALSIEDYILYKNQAMAQVNSQMETVQLLGIIKQFCFDFNVPCFLRPAVAVKTRWKDEILVYKNIIIKKGSRYIARCRPDRALCDHERDSIRHAVHFNTFENYEED